jgi:hypothetical protein
MVKLDAAMISFQRLKKIGQIDPSRLGCVVQAVTAGPVSECGDALVMVR